MVYKKSTGLNDTTVVRSNILRNTDNRMYVSTAAGIRAINTDGSYSTLANTCGVNPMFLTIPIIVISYQREQVQSSFAQHSGQKVYELKDHLGNVRAVVTDRKFLTGGTTPKYKAELASVTDYYAYGSPLYGRTYTSAAGSYRFGFNTQEKVAEISGDGNHNTALFWEYDTRLGRRWNLDPKPQINISDYAVMGCNPILCNDILGNTFVTGNAKSEKKSKKVDVQVNEEGEINYTFEKGTKNRDKKKFEKKTLPILKSMAKSEKGREDIKTMNNMDTRIDLKLRKGLSKTGGNSDLYKDDNLPLTSNSQYQYAIIRPAIGEYKWQKNSGLINSSGIDEWLGATMTVEVGHLMTDQIATERTLNVDDFVTKGTSDFVKGYSPLLQRATSYRILYRLENNIPIDYEVLDPINKANVDIYSGTPFINQIQFNDFHKFIFPNEIGIY